MVELWTFCAQNTLKAKTSSRLGRDRALRWNTHGNTIGSVRDVIVIVVANGHGDPSSNPG